MRKNLIVVALLVAALLPGAALAAVTGNIAGAVTDQATGKALAGVTVTVSGPALQQEQTEFTDAAGRYIITELPPGEYVVRFYFSNIKIERPNVVLSADKTLTVNATMPTKQAKAQTYRIVEKAPTVDVGNTQVQTQVTQELVRNTPVAGRTYESVLTLAPGSTTDAVGFSFNGATGPENAFLIDGLNTTSPAYGLVGTSLSLEFIKETEIITGGYNAEYGRATGGVVNVITKSGSNEFHGGAWLYYTPFQLDPERIARFGESIAQTTKTKNGFDFGFDVGGPILKDRIWFYAGFAPNFRTYESTRILRSRLADNLDPNQSSGSYAGDVDNDLQCPSWLNQGGNKVLCPPVGGYLTTDLAEKYWKRYESTDRSYQWIAKLNFQFNENNSLALQYIGTPATFDGYGALAPNYNAAGTLNGGDGGALLSESMQVHDVLARFVSKMLDRKLQLDILAGYHHESDSIAPNKAAGGNDAYHVDTRTGRSLADYESVPDCQVQDIHGVRFNPCPVSNYGTGGLGYLFDTTAQRFNAAAGLTWFARLAGTHAIKLGADFEWNAFRNHRWYTGGDGGGLYTTLDYGGGVYGVDRQQFGTIDADGVPRLMPEGFEAKTSTLNEGIYLRDSWNVGFIPGLTINAGVRWELQQVKGTDGTTQISITDNIAPRVGFIYDFTRKGYSKIYASYGRFYESIPLGINDRQFSGEGLAYQTVLVDTNMGGQSACQFDPATGLPNPATCKYPDPTRGEVNGGTYGKVSPVLKGQYSNEVVAGLQYDVGWDVVLGAAYVHRDLGRVIEDLSPNGGSDYIIANPGEATDKDVVKDLQKQIDDLGKQVQSSGNEADRAAIGQKRLDAMKTLQLYQDVASFPKGKRDYNAMVLTVTKRFSRNFTVLASYTYSRTLGNFPGLFQPANGQLDPNISSQFDLKELLLNRDGPLPYDRPHNFKLTGAYSIPIGAKGALTLGLNFSAISGRPIEVLGRHPVYGSLETFILPRGAGGRTPTTTRFDLHIAYGHQFGKGFKAELIWDTFNLFNQHGVTAVDDEYTTDRVMPIANGTLADLTHLKTTSGTPVRVNPNYGQARGYQAPLSMRFGLRVSF